MKSIYALIAGAFAGLAAIFLHLILPPLGVMFAIIGSALTVWAVGRFFGLRRYKAIAVAGWLLPIIKGASLGVGNELLIQGNPQGAALVFLGVFLLVILIFFPA